MNHLFGVYTRVCIYYKHVVVFTYLNSIVYDWLIYTAIRQCGLYE